MMFRHLRENNMGYLEHLVFAVSHGVTAIVIGIALCIHAILPFLFPRAGRALFLRLQPDFSPLEMDPRKFDTYLRDRIETR